jgi:putative ABC transport system substrate-binding protein
MLLNGGAMATTRVLRAQQKALPVIGFLAAGLPGPGVPFVAAFRQGLSEAGYVEGQNLAIEYRWAESHYDRLPALAVDLVGRKIDLIATRALGPYLNVFLATQQAVMRLNAFYSVVKPVSQLTAEPRDRTLGCR